jgi:hypothetical protein
MNACIPEPGNAGDWNRYAYVLYNPANFNDPTGHWIGDDGDPYGAETAEELADFYRIDITGIRDILPDWIPTRDPLLFEAYLDLLIVQGIFCKLKQEYPTDC